MDAQKYAYIEALERENEYLKSLLDNAGIPYKTLACASEGATAYDPNQGARILPKTITPADANKFFSMFWGRTDVYSKRCINKSTGGASYYTQCYNFWKAECPRTHGSKIRCRDCNKRAYKKLEIKQIIDHLHGDAEDGTDVIGIYPLLPDDTCRFIVFDFDNRSSGTERNDFANEDESWKEEVDALRTICKINDVDALVERSRSGRGAHLWIFFQKPVEASLARRFGNALLDKGTESVNLKSFRFYDRMLPMQDHLPEGGLGNLIALPLQGQALKRGNSAFIDENWNAYPDQWAVLLSKQKYSRNFIETKLREWYEQKPLKAVDGAPVVEDGEKPWDRTKHFIRQDIDGELHITLADGIYVDTVNLAPRIQNRLRELAAFKNPAFYKNQAMGLSNFKQSRYIYLGCDVKDYIKLPRGLLKNITAECEKAGITYTVEDVRNCGRKINVSFTGELKENQAAASEALLKEDNGILSAATAFGKTVVCCNIIAQRKTSTLILLQSSSLVEQWMDALNRFLVIDEEPPEYKTPSGKTKRRKSVIGLLQSGHDSTTGIIDIAMVGSVCRKGEFHRRLKEYGLIILDECHHAASDTIVNILQEVSAKYIYGATATPTRGDGLEKINYMLLGPVLYRYTAKERAKEQGIEHLVYPRFTRAIVPSFKQKKMDANEAYKIIRNNPDRDDIIVGDVIHCVSQGRTPVVLSKYVDHTKRLYECLKSSADRVFLLIGEDTKNVKSEIIRQMKQVKPEESMILLATGQLVGEGFDLPRLDTLIMAPPVSGKSIVEQYAGRLNRDYKGKKDVIIYDYVDSHIPVFDQMYHKRLRAYKHIGYDIYSGQISRAKPTNAIFDMDTYAETYRQDLLSASEEIILSSPAISARKIDGLTRLLAEKQKNGLRVIVVTWMPDRYGYSDSSDFAALHDTMRRAGIDVNLVTDYCDHYCIVDRQIVWYGSMNFLGKEDVEDNLMRVCSEQIANELLEMTFGEGKGKAIPYRENSEDNRFLL